MSRLIMLLLRARQPAVLQNLTSEIYLAMGCSTCVSVILALSILANVFCLPASLRPRRQTSDDQASTPGPGTSTPGQDTSTAKSSDVSVSEKNDIAVPPAPYNDDDDGSFETSSQAPSGGGSNISSLFSLLGAFLPGSSGSNKLQEVLHKVLKEFIKNYKPRKIIKRDISDNEIDVDKKPYSRQEIDENESNSDDSDDTSEEKRNESEESDEDYDEPPGGDGQGGGLLGLLAGLSGGEDGQSDLGSLLGTISGIVANLSGDGIDLNSLIASGIGLFAGLLSQGEENPGAVIASYLLTSLDTITGGGSKNNGKFFGTFLSKLIKGTSAALDPDASSEEEGRVPQKDSVGFVVSLLAGLLGDMSGGSSAPHRRRWTDDDF